MRIGSVDQGSQRLARRREGAGREAPPQPRIKSGAGLPVRFGKRFQEMLHELGPVSTAASRRIIGGGQGRVRSAPSLGAGLVHLVNTAIPTILPFRRNRV